MVDSFHLSGKPDTCHLNMAAEYTRMIVEKLYLGERPVERVQWQEEQELDQVGEGRG